VGLTGKRVMILIENMYNELEYWYPYYRLKEAGAEVVTVGNGAGQYTSKAGLPAKADTDAKNVRASDFDGIIIPGGYAPDIMRRYPEMVKLVKEADDAGKVIGAICHAGWMLASAKILKNRHITSFFAIKDDLIHAGGKWVDEEAVIDRNLITSRKPDDLPAFMRAVISTLKTI
jgi:protease I